MPNKLFKLSPSDFKYLWEDCKHCYHQKVVRGIYLPSIGMPGVFNKMTGMLQETIQGMSLKDIDSNLPSGIINAKETYLKSTPIPPTKDSFISGRLDVLSTLEDGTYGLIDFKITEQDEEKAKKFSRQLHAYKFALENPLQDAPRKVSKMGLIIVSPDSISFEDGQVVFKTKPTWFEIKEDMEGFYDFISEVSSLLNNPVPESTRTCKWCAYRDYFSTDSEDVQEEIPF